MSLRWKVWCDGVFIFYFLFLSVSYPYLIAMDGWMDGWMSRKAINRQGGNELLSSLSFLCRALS
jgi:hypothetical protein